MIDALRNRMDRTPNTSLEDRIKLLTDGVKMAQDSFGRTVAANPHKDKSWWCKSTMDPIVETRNRARQWFILTKSEEAAECYRQWCAYFREMVKTLKQKAWWRFLEDSSETAVWKALKFTKRSKAQDILPLRRMDGSITSNKAEQAELLFVGTSCINAPVELADIPPRGQCRIVWYPTVKSTEVTSCIKKIASRKAPGIDGIANEMLKLSAPALAPILTNIFNQALLSSTYPNAWKCAVTAIVPKAGKDDYTDPNAY
jgi:hypothetical protein